MTEAKTPRLLWALVNNRGERLRDPESSVCLPVFDYAIQALKYADGLGISREVYDIVRVGGEIR